MLFHEKNLEKKIASFKRKMHFVNKEYNEKQIIVKMIFFVKTKQNTIKKRKLELIQKKKR